MHCFSVVARELWGSSTRWRNCAIEGILTGRKTLTRNGTPSISFAIPATRSYIVVRKHSTASHSPSPSPSPEHPTKANAEDPDRLDPTPSDYSSVPFIDSCLLNVSAGAGGHGCISFLREKYIANGPPNGGDGGTGGSVYIQAVQGETSLHKLARRGALKAGRGKNGQGSGKGGSRGEDLLITVPVGTVVREISRRDPLIEEDLESRRNKGYGRDFIEDQERDAGEEGTDQTRKWRRDRWLVYPGVLPKAFTVADFPALPRPRRSNLTALQPPAPLRLDLDTPMKTPVLIAAGAMGGMGNPHFVTKSLIRPKFATKGDEGMRLNLQLELKLLADVGLVGLPNAGKSTLLRAITRSRTRVGNWAFTTLTPNIGTVVLDPHVGRPVLDTKGLRKEPRVSFTVADIPGLIEDAHLDRGLGLGFLRHIERAAVLAFVVDLSAGDAVQALKALWREIGEYEKLKHAQAPAAEDGTVSYQPLTTGGGASFPEFLADSGGRRDSMLEKFAADSESLKLPPISSKPWFVVATKADIPNTEENFRALRQYLHQVEAGKEMHPSCKAHAWHKSIIAVPVSAVNKQGVESIPGLVVDLLDRS